MHFKKIFLVLSLSLCSIGFCTKTLAAGEPPATCVGLIECAELTYVATLQVLKSVNRLPEFIEAWVAEDNSEESYTPTLQENFVQYINYTLTNDDTQMDSQKSFLNDYFANAKSLPYVNQLSFTTLLGRPYSDTQEKDQNGQPVNSAYQYVKNASGLNIRHDAPSDNWRGTKTNIQKYTDYYKTISAVQSFNTYVLSALYADSQNKLNLTKKQKELLEQASNPNWFIGVASENIGIVLRQILLFNSQTYVMLIKMYDIQKQQLAAQSMANTLLIMGNQFTEKDLYNRATGAASSLGG